MELKDFQQQINIIFNDEELLRQALTHRSFVNEHVDTDLDDNERLEYLGDAILDFITADMLFRRFPTMPEGEMTRLRSALVRTEALALIANDCNLGPALIMGKGEANSGGRERESILASGFEAVIGAIYIDQGLQPVRDFVIPKLTTLQKDVMDEAIRKDPRSQFQEWAQAVYGITPTFHTVGSSGPEHKKLFEVAVSIDGQIVAIGRGRNKRSAAQDAAKTALQHVETGELHYKPVPSPAISEDQPQ